mmetsp:Transcript_102590/g.185052  ORF Transcript_102590/g.185052 Transcript_102590/m.185052 type:complete len:87 (-) Transcript_102590:83-343(-)
MSSVRNYRQLKPFRAVGGAPRIEIPWGNGRLKASGRSFHKGPYSELTRLRSAGSASERTPRAWLQLGSLLVDGVQPDIWQGKALLT